MSDTEKKSMMFLNMDFRMTTSIPFLFFCLCMSKIFTIYFIFFAKLCKCYFFKHVQSFIMAVFSQLIKETTILCLCLYMNLA